MLNLDFDDEQDMLREMVRGICDRHSPLEEVRRLEDDPVGVASDLWEQMGELGICGLMLPDAYGGSAMGALEGVVVYEELGRSLASVPHLVSCVLSAEAILAAGNETQKSELLPQLSAGNTILTPAWLEPGNGFGPAGVQMRADDRGSDFVLDGTKMHVYFATAAERMLVLARTGDAETGIDLFVVPTDADGVTLTQKMSISSDTQYRVDFDNVTVPAADRVGEAGSGWSTWQSITPKAAVLAAAQAIGGATQALDLTVDYSKNREQFDKPLAAFQAISHSLADAKTSLDGGRLLVHEAAWAMSSGKNVDRLAPMAKLNACNIYRDITALAQQVFGGVGFTLDYDIQLYFRRAKQLQLSWWDSRTCEELIAAAVLD